MKEDKYLRVVLDTNVLISALGFRALTKAIWELVEENRFQLFTSAFILQELERNLIKKADLDPAQAKAIIDDVLGLVTGDLKHIRVLGHFHGIEILTPQEFLFNIFEAWTANKN